LETAGLTTENSKMYVMPEKRSSHTYKLLHTAHLPQEMTTGIYSPLNQPFG
jgi:hypothetical protein